MDKFKFNTLPQLRVLNDDQIKEMHETALNVLENLGIIFG